MDRGIPSPGISGGGGIIGGCASEVPGGIGGENSWPGISGGIGGRSGGGGMSPGGGRSPVGIGGGGGGALCVGALVS